MKTKSIATTLIAASIALGPVQASAGDALAGAVVGAIIGGIVVNEAHKNRNRKTAQTTVRRPTVSTAQRDSNREVQSALNYFGYNVGTPDGVLGQKSRTGISQYQALMGYPPTGQLTDFERSILTGAYQRGVVGGPLAMQVAATHPQGARGLLLLQRDEIAGVVNPGMGGMVAGAGMGGMAGGAMGGAVIGGGIAPAAPVPTFGLAPASPTAPATPGALPNFFGGGGPVAASLASHCNKVSLLTTTNGGFVTAASMTDPVFALSEQFCLARTFAIAQGEELVAKVPGATPAQIAEQCQALGPALADSVNAVSLQDRDSVLRGVQDFALASGMAPAQLAATARICLGSGYATDTMDVAVGSALLLTALGERGYSELLGHHLAQGFGASQRVDLALPWYEMSLEAAGPGAAMVFAPGMADRAGLIRKAAFTISGKERAALEPAKPAVPVFAVPAAPTPGVLAAVTPTPAPAPAGGVVRTGVEALPLAARLPFLVFGN